MYVRVDYIYMCACCILSGNMDVFCMYACIYVCMYDLRAFMCMYVWMDVWEWYVCEPCNLPAFFIFASYPYTHTHTLVHTDTYTHTHTRTPTQNANANEFQYHLPFATPYLGSYVIPDGSARYHYTTMQANPNYAWEMWIMLKVR